ncbi:MAG: OsmC family protein [Chloroflexi bacterium]|nr:MAG: OsmC family protein [Chloroflexota bacterium]
MRASWYEGGRMSNDDLVVNRVHSESTATPGRSISQVRDRELVIDEPTHLGGPGEEITPADAFLAGVSACGVLLVQGRARDTAVGLKKIDVNLEAVRHRSDTSVFQRIDMTFRLAGPSQAQAVELVEHYKSH